MRVLLKQERTFLPNFNRTNVFKLLEILFTATERFCCLTKYCSLVLNNFTFYLSLERWLEVFLCYIDKVSFLLKTQKIKINNCSKNMVILIFL